MNQKDLNRRFEDPAFNGPKIFVGIIRLLYAACLFSSIYPISLLFIFIGSVLYYWIIKYNFIRRQVLKYTLNQEIS